MMKIIGRDDLVDDPRYATVENLKEKHLQPELIEILEGGFVQKTLDEWLPILAEWQVPSQKVFRYTDIVKDEEAYVNDAIRKVNYQAFGERALPTTPIRYASRRPRWCCPSPSATTPPSTCTSTATPMSRSPRWKPPVPSSAITARKCRTSSSSPSASSPARLLQLVDLRPPKEPQRIAAVLFLRRPRRPLWLKRLQLPQALQQLDMSSPSWRGVGERRRVVLDAAPADAALLVKPANWDAAVPFAFTGPFGRG